MARITYELTGATFAGTVGSSVLTSSVDATTEVISGGAQGDSSVTIELTLNALAELNSTFKFSVPMLQVTPAVLSSHPDTGAPTAMGVGVSTSIATRKSSGTPFSTSIQDATDVTAEDGSALTGDNNLADPVLVGSQQVYNTMTPALTFAWAAPWSSTSKVDVQSRKDIIRAGASATDPMAKSTAKATPSLLVGTVNITSAGAAAVTPKDLGGRDAAVIKADNGNALTEDKYELGKKLSGTADVTVTGAFQSGDAVYLGAKALTVAGGVASGSVGIEGLLQSKGMKVIYVPGGVDDLKPSTFVAVGTLSFDDDMNASPRTGPRATGGVSVGNIVYDGYTSQGYAYGVIGGSDSEKSFVRIGCTSASGCNVFLDCTDETGMAYFGELPAIGGNATSVSDSGAIATALDGGWSAGKGSCSLVSNAGLEIQHMVRTGMALANSSVVVNKAVAPHPAHSAINVTCTLGVDLNGDGDTVDNDATTGGVNEATTYACK